MITNVKIYKNDQILDLLDRPSQPVSIYDENVKNFVLSLIIKKNTFVLDKSIGSSFLNDVCRLFPHELEDGINLLIKDLASHYSFLNITKVEISKKPNTQEIIIKISLLIDSDIYLICLEMIL